MKERLEQSAGSIKRRCVLAAVMCCSILMEACSMGHITIPAGEFPVAGAGQATFVVIRVRQPSGQGSEDAPPATIIDDKRRLLGQLPTGSRTSFIVPAGPVHLCALIQILAEADHGEFGDCIQGHVAAGLTYYATIGYRWGGILFLSLSPRTKDNRWEHLQEYLERTAVMLDPARVQEEQRRILDMKISPIEYAGRYAARGTAAHTAERTVLPEDGVSATRR